MYESVLEQVVGHLLMATGHTFRSGGPRGPVDFIAGRDESQRVYIEVKGDRVRSEQINSVLGKFARVAATDNQAQIWLVTPSSPSPQLLHHFQEGVRGTSSRAEWLSLAQLAQRLGWPDPIDVNRLEDIDALRDAAITTNIRKYEPAVIHRPIAPELVGLGRQISHRVLSRLELAQGDIEDKLSFSRPVTNAVVVLSDIVQFTTLVRVAKPDFLRGAMSRYYRRARELVWEHDGVLDKFIGDAVLAIFGYPFPDPAAATKATRFACHLVAAGRDLLCEFQSLHNDAIRSGTRVGVASDDLWVLDIGKEGIEVSFVGTVINLAARLQAACAVDGVLIDAITVNRLSREHGEFSSLSGFEPERVLDEKAAKGLLTAMRCRQVPPSVVADHCRGERSAAGAEIDASSGTSTTTHEVPRSEQSRRGHA